MCSRGVGWPCRTSEEFSQFAMRKGLRLVRSPPYHPCIQWVGGKRSADIQRAVQVGDVDHSSLSVSVAQDLTWTGRLNRGQGSITV